MLLYIRSQCPFKTMLSSRPSTGDHLCTANPIESVFATVRHRTVRTKGALSQDTARRRWRSPLGEWPAAQTRRRAGRRRCSGRVKPDWAKMAEAFGKAGLRDRVGPQAYSGECPAHLADGAETRLNLSDFGRRAGGADLIALGSCYEMLLQRGPYRKV